MRRKLLACEVFQPELDAMLRRRPGGIEHEYLPFGLHEQPDKLRVELQAKIDSIPADTYDVILVAYCLCSRAVVGLTARHTPLVLPKAHDCITVLLGSRKRYAEEFAREPGTYYYSPGWVQRSESRKGNPYESPTQSTAAAICFQEYVARYGEDNAKYLMEVESAWTTHYTRAAFINTGVGDVAHCQAFVRKIAADNNWKYEQIEGSPDLLERFLAGPWDGDFVIVPPGQQVVARYDDDVLSTGRAAG